MYAEEAPESPEQNRIARRTVLAKIIVIYDSEQTIGDFFDQEAFFTDWANLFEALTIPLLNFKPSEFCTDAVEPIRDILRNEGVRGKSKSQGLKFTFWQRNPSSLTSTFALPYVRSGSSSVS